MIILAGTIEKRVRVPNQNDIGNRLWFGIIEIAIIFNAICLLLMNYTLSVLVRHLTVSSVIAA